MNFDYILKSINPNVIAMLSGGKDSIASVVMLKKAGVPVTAIHFIHKWGSEIPTNEAKRICKQFDIPLIIYDFTKEFSETVIGYQAGRPCLICKKTMYSILLDYLSSQKYGWLCIGDNANDRTTIARIKDYISNNKLNESLKFNTYWGSEMGMVLPASISVVRPLIDLSINEVEAFLSQEGIKVKRINSTGDKYFEYHREGCPIQFADIGVELDETLFSDLKIYNDAITDFARKNNILASIHMPSTFIITIPTGYETKAIKSLQEKGLHVNELANSSRVDFQSYHSHIYELNSGLNNSIVYEKIFNRLKERLELFGQCNHIYQNDNQISCSYKDQNNQLKVYFDFDTLTADIVYSFSDNSTARIEIELFDNLMLELFRTRKYKVSKL